MPELKPMSEMHGIVDEKSAKEYLSAIARNIADQSAMAAMIAVEWGIDASYIPTLLVVENERAQKDMILEALNHLASRFTIDMDSNDPEEEDV